MLPGGIWAVREEKVALRCRFLRRREARAEYQKYHSEERREDRGVLGAFCVVRNVPVCAWTKRNSPDAPPAQDLSEIRWMTGPLPETFLHYLILPRLSRFPLKLLGISDALDRPTGDPEDDADDITSIAEGGVAARLMGYGWRVEDDHRERYDPDPKDLTNPKS